MVQLTSNMLMGSTTLNNMVQGLTLQQLQGMKTQAPTGGLTLQQLQTMKAPAVDHLNGFQTIDTPPPQTAQGPFGQTYTFDRPSYLEQVKTAFKSGIDTANAGVADAQGGNSLQRGEAALKFGAGVAGAATSFISPVISAALGKLLQTAGEGYGTFLPQGFADTPTGQTTSRIATDVSNAGTIAGTLAGAKGGADRAPIVTQAVKDIYTTTPAEAAALDATKTAAKQATMDAKVTKIANEWQKPTTVQTANFNKTRDALGVAPDSPKFLAQQGITPASVIEDGRYATEPTAQALRDTAAKMSHDTLRPSLEIADYAVPKTPVADIAIQAVRDAEGNKYLTAGNRESIVANIQKEAEALQRKHPDGMSLTDLHDNKITYAQNAGYHPLKTASDNNLATANRSLASAMQHTVETKAPKDIPVNDFNAYLSKFYKAADYLDTLNTKKAPVSLGQAITRGVAKFGGAAVGEHLGGGVISAFAGYSIGRAIEHAVENLTTPMRAQFLRNLEVSNPEAFTKVQAYLKNMTSGNTGTPRLNPGSFIAPKPPSETTQMKGRADQLAPK